MDFLDSVRRATTDLTNDGTDLAAQVALLLAIDSWRHLAGTDAAWDWFALELLDLQERLFPEPEVVLLADPPADDGPTVRVAVVGLVDALAEHYARSAADERAVLAERLGADAIVQQLRRASAMLR